MFLTNGSKLKTSRATSPDSYVDHSITAGCSPAPDTTQVTYKAENFIAFKGLQLYCRVHGNEKDGVGYGKILVEEVTEKPPADVEVLEGQ